MKIPEDAAGPMEFGRLGRLHTANLARLSEELPFIVEIVDPRENVERFVPRLDEMFTGSGSGGLVTWETVKVLRYGKW